jgi:hypothetical protein
VSVSSRSDTESSDASKAETGSKTGAEGTNTSGDGADNSAKSANTAKLSDFSLPFVSRTMERHSSALHTIYSSLANENDAVSLSVLWSRKLGLDIWNPQPTSPFASPAGAVSLEQGAAAANKAAKRRHNLHSSLNQSLTEFTSLSSSSSLSSLSTVETAEYTSPDSLSSHNSTTIKNTIYKNEPISTIGDASETYGGVLRFSFFSTGTALLVVTLSLLHIRGLLIAAKNLVKVSARHKEYE